MKIIFICVVLLTSNFVTAMNIANYSLPSFSNILNEDSAKILKKEKEMTKLKLDILEKKANVLSIEAKIEAYTIKVQDAKKNAVSEATDSYYANANAVKTINANDAKNARKKAKQAFKKAKQAESLTNDLNDEIKLLNSTKQGISKMEDDLKKMENN